MLTVLSYCFTGENCFASLLGWSRSVTALTWGRCRNMNQASLMYPFSKVSLSAPASHLLRDLLETSSSQFKAGQSGTTVLQRHPVPTAAALSSCSPHAHAAAADALVWFLPSSHPFRSSFPHTAPWCLQVLWVTEHKSVVSDHTQILLKPYG